MDFFPFCPFFFPNHAIRNPIVSKGDFNNLSDSSQKSDMRKVNICLHIMCRSLLPPNHIQGREVQCTETAVLLAARH